MLDPRLLYRHDEPAWTQFVERDDDDLVLLHFFEGFVDAGQVSHTISRHLLEHCEHEPIATFDVDQLHDYRSRRPVMTFDTDHWESVRSPQLVLHRVEDASGRAFLMLVGPEPDTQWARVSAAVQQIADDLQVQTAATAYGIPLGVPHTRPTTITGHSTRGDLGQDNALWLGRIEVPGSISSMLEMRLGEDGIRSLGLATHVPHYVSGAPFGQAVLAAIRRLAEITGLDLPEDGLAQTAQDNVAEIDAEMEGSAEVRQVVTALEEQYDSGLGTLQVPSAQEIGAEFERFLAEQDRRDEA